MDPKKRNFMFLTIPAALAVRFGLFSGLGLAQTQRPQNSSPSPPPATPLSTPSLPDGPKLDPKEILKKNQGQIYDDVEDLTRRAADDLRLPSPRTQMQAPDDTLC